MDGAESQFWHDKTIAIWGLGLIGGSYAKGLRRLGVRKIIAVDRDEQSLAQAEADGIIDVALTKGTEALREGDMIIFCMPAQAIMESIREYSPYFRRDVVLTDVAGIKGTMAEEIFSFLPDGMDFISGHPMAGREGSGYGMARADIFDGANYIVVPHDRNQGENIQLVERLARDLGCAHVVKVTPKEHDRLIAYTSSLPHVLATALVNSESMSDKTKYFVAGSFRDATRVADINADMWTTLLLANKDNLRREIKRYIDVLQHVSHLLEQEDADQLHAYLEQAGKRRKELIHERNSH